MTLLNITYVIYCPLKNTFVDWLQTKWIPSARQAGLSQPRLARVLGGDDPDSVSLALEMTSPSVAVAQRFLHGAQAETLVKEMRKQWGQKVLHFATLLDVIQNRPQ